ncbi:MAG: hypothetical protein ACI9GZ_004308 [Bacteroidia bacterium]|jgi:hypothetical protein
MAFEKNGHILLTNSAAKQLLGYNHLTHLACIIDEHFKC